MQEDEVLYDDLVPWPTAADGSGQSLQRRATHTYGNAAGSWIAALPTPGFYEASTLRGDFNGDGVVNEVDINLLFVQLRSENPDLSYDLTNDGLVDEADRDEMIFNILDSTYGDSDLNGLFNTADLVLVLQAGQYEDGIAGNSLWETGDWDGDGEFGTGDIVLALQTGDYETGAARVTNALPDFESIAAALETSSPVDLDEPPVIESRAKPASSSVATQQSQLVDAVIESLFAEDRTRSSTDSSAVDDLLAATRPYEA